MLNFTNVSAKLFIFKQINLEAILNTTGGMLLMALFIRVE